MESGDFAVIGKDITAAASPKLPVNSGCGPEERIVQVPRGILARAKAFIPSCPDRPSAANQRLGNHLENRSVIGWVAGGSLG